MTTAAACGLLALLLTTSTHAFSPPLSRHHHTATIVYNGWTSDFDDFQIEQDDEDPFSMSKIIGQQQENDLSACQTRQFSLGADFILSDFAGSMGFDEVTDWEYYYQDEDSGDKQVVPPPPLDPSKPKRTRASSGSVVRIFRGEFQGRLGATLQAQGLDKRLLVKEFSGTLALELARAELESIAKLQSQLVQNDSSAQDGEWVRTAVSRSVLTRKDDANLGTLLKLLSKAPYTGVLGEVNLAELEGDLDPNEFYRALGVQPPKPGSVWIVYEYTGLSTVAAYCQPAMMRVARMPVQRGLFGAMAPPSLPPWKDRARYVVQGIIKGALEAVANLHESGIAHRSIGRSSVLLGSVAMDKQEAPSPYATNLARLVVKLADFGFSGSFEDSTRDEGFVSRARSFGLQFRKGESSAATKGYAMAEDLHALGFVVLGLLLTSLAEPPTPEYNMPATDEDTLQRLLADIFEKDMDQFRDYVEAEDIWSNVVELLDDKDGAGWEFLGALLLARERAAQDGELLTARGLLSSPFLQR